MVDASSIAWTKNDLPYNWDPDRAMTFVEVARTIKRYLREGLPIERQHLLVIFFHESGFANVRQNRGKGPAVGFGQMEIFNKDKIPFFETLKLNAAILNPRVLANEKKNYTYLEKYFPLTYESVLNDNEFAIRMHCAYFGWLYDQGIPANPVPGQKGIKSLRGLLTAQTGAGRNEVFVDHFINSGAQLKDAMNSGDRQKLIDALNSVRKYFKQDTAILEDQTLSLSRYRKYWDFILPEIGRAHV